MFDWAPGTAEALPHKQVAAYSALAGLHVGSERSQGIVKGFLYKGQDDTARAQQLLKRRGEKFKLSDLVLPAWQVENGR